MAKPYSNRELDEKFTDIKQDLTNILMQTTKHNGRMTSIEKWQYTMGGGLAVLAVIVVPVLGWALFVLANISTTVHASVDQALSAYNIKNTNTVAQ